MKKCFFLLVVITIIHSTNMLSQNMSRDISELKDVTINKVVFYEDPLIFENQNLTGEVANIDLKWLKAFYSTNCPPCFGGDFDTEAINYLDQGFRNLLQITNESLINFKNIWRSEILPSMPVKNTVVFVEYYVSVNDKDYIFVRSVDLVDVNEYSSSNTNANIITAYVLNNERWLRTHFTFDDIIKNDSDTKYGLPNHNEIINYTENYYISTKGSDLKRVLTRK